jgi:hypothetical protein
VTDTGNKTAKPGTDREQRGDKEMTLFIVFSIFLFHLVPVVPGFPTPPTSHNASPRTAVGQVVVRRVDHGAYPLTGNREQTTPNSTHFS